MSKRPYRWTPQGLQKRRQRNADPAVRARHAAAMADPAVRARKSAAMKLAMADPAVRARKSAAMKLAMADPAVRAGHAAAMADPAVRARHAAAMADPAVRARQEKNAGWLSAAERASVVASLRAGASYDDVAADWLLSYGRVCQIAKEEGLQRRPRRKGANAAAVSV